MLEDDSEISLILKWVHENTFWSSELSQSLKPINYIPCGEVDPKDFAHFHYVKFS
jgi:hypothetical protein